MSAGKGKREADGPLTTTSSSSDEDSPRYHPVVKQNLEQKLGKNNAISISFHTGNADKFLSRAGLLATPRIMQTHQHSDRRRPQLKKKRGDSDKEELRETKLQTSTPRNMQQRGKQCCSLQYFNGANFAIIVWIWKSSESIYWLLVGLCFNRD